MRRTYCSSRPPRLLRKVALVSILATLMLVTMVVSAFADGTVTGRIRNEDTNALGAIVQALDAETLDVVGTTTAVLDAGQPAGGSTSYSLTLPAGTYILRADDPVLGTWCYSGKVALNVDEAERIVVTDGQTLDRTDLRLFPVGGYVGRVVDAVGNPLEGVKVEAWLNDGPPEGWGAAHFTYTDENGEYRINLDTMHFDYVLAYRDMTSEHRSMVYPDVADLDDAGATIHVPVKDFYAALADVSMDWGTHVTGTLTSAMDDPAAEFVVGGPADGIEARIWKLVGGEWVRSPMYWVENNIDGTYDIVGLWPGTYRLSFDDPHEPHVWFDKVYTVPDSRETSVGLGADVVTSEETKTVVADAEMWLWDGAAPLTQVGFTPAGPWVSAPSVTATFSATDDVWGVAGTLYSLDGSAETSYTDPVTITGEGLHTVLFRSVDLAGNMEETRTAQIGIDTSAPTASVVGEQPEWYTEAASISIDATDAVSGVKEVRYRIDGGAETVYAGSVMIAQEGVHSLEYWAVDNAGNESAPQTLQVRVDLGAPAVSSNIGDAWSKTAVTVTLSATDPGAGIASIRYRIAGGADQLYTTPFTVSAQGPNLVEYWAVDNLGNASPVIAKTVKIDAVAPTTTSNAVGAYSGTATIKLSPTDAHSGVAFTRYKVDGGAETSGTTVSVAAPGAHTVTFWSVDQAGNVETVKTVNFTVTATSVASVNVTGANRFAVAVRASQIAFPSGAPAVVVVASDKWADSVAAAPLAGAANAPILLTGRDTLNAATLTEIRRLGATHAYIVGGTASVGAPVETALRTALGGANRVTRIAGADRYVVADAAARRALTVHAANGKTWDGTAVLVTGRDFADALTVSPVASRKVWPVVLAEPDGLGSLTDRAVTNAKSMGVKRVVVVGGDRSVTPEMLAKLSAAGIPTQIRLSGADRYAAAVSVAKWAVSTQGFSYNRLAIANGAEFADALSGGVLQGKTGSVLLLTRGDRLAPAVDTLLRQQRGAVAEVRFIGGTATLTTAVRSAVVVALTP